MKQCKKCGVVKPLDQFYAHPRMKDGHLNQCIPCRDAYVKEWTAKNKERRREICRESSARVKLRDPEKVNSNQRLYYQKMKKSGAYWAKILEKQSRYRFHPKATPSWADREQILAFYQEAMRRTEESGMLWTVDHIVPLKSDRVCGLHTHHNLQVITKAANSRKKNKHWPDM